MDLVIVGAGSVSGHIVHNLQEYAPSYNLLGFVDDNSEKHGKEIWGHKVLGPVDRLLEMSNVAVVVGIAFPRIKSRIVAMLSANESLSFPSLISSRAWVSSGTNIGKGSIIYPGVSINYGCTIQDFVVLNMNCAIGHDCIIGNYSSLAPGVNFAGHTYVGEGADIGIGSSTRQKVKVGDYAIVGGQTMLVSDVANWSTVTGVPGKEVFAMA